MAGNPFPLAKEQLLQAYRTMRTIREFEERLHIDFGRGDIPGFVHLYAGEEATGTGIMMHLGDGDRIASTHRGHGHCIAKGVDVVAVIDADEVADLVRHDRAQIVDHVIVAHGQLVEGEVDLQVGVEDIARLRVEGHRGLGQGVALAVEAPLRVLEEDDVGVGAILVELGGVAAHVGELGEGDGGLALGAVEVGPGDEGIFDHGAHLLHGQVGRAVSLQAEADAEAGPGEGVTGELAALQIAIAAAGAGGAAAEGLRLRGGEQEDEEGRAPGDHAHDGREYSESPRASHSLFRASSPDLTPAKRDDPGGSDQRERRGASPCIAARSAAVPTWR